MVDTAYLPLSCNALLNHGEVLGGLYNSASLAFISAVKI